MAAGAALGLSCLCPASWGWLCPLVFQWGGHPFTLGGPRTQGGGRQAPPGLLWRPAACWTSALSSTACSHPRSELIQLVAVTQKTAERSYREHIEQQIQTYQRRWETPAPTYVPTIHASFLEPGDAGPGQSGVSGGELLPSGPQSSAF